MKRFAGLLLLVAAPLVAQQPRNSTSAPPSAVSTIRSLWEDVAGYIARAADQMPESNYAFKATPEVRSFGQLIGHIAGSENLSCGLALGEKVGNEDDVERTATTKAALVTAIKAANDRCRRAYAVSDAASAKMVTLFGADRTALYALMQNATHISEHYGNIVTYMRLKGMVPPSSQPPAR